MTLEVQNTDPKAPANIGNAGPSATPIPQGSAPAAAPAPIVPGTPGAPAPVEDWKGKHDRLVNESIPQLQSRAATEKNRADALVTEVATLKAQLSEFGDIDELTYEIGHERDEAIMGWLEDNMRGGFTLSQVVGKLREDMRSVNGQREQLVSSKANVEATIEVVDGYDKAFGDFLRKMSKHGTEVSMSTIPGLRATYDSLTAGGRTPAQAAAAAVADPAAAATAGAEPPVVAAPGGGAKPGDAPVWRPGMRSRDLLKTALAGAFGTTFERTPRK